MRRLKPRPRRIDTLRSEARPKKRGRVGRVVYLVFLAGLAVVIFDTFIGELFYLSGSGMVTRDVSVVSVGYRGRVAQLTVSEGDRVEAGETLMRIPSEHMESELAQLSSDLADAEARAARLRAQRDKLDKLLPEARQRLETLEDFRQRLQRLGDRGLTTLAPRAQTLMDSFEALRDVREWEAQQKALKDRLGSTKGAALQARTALIALRDIYDSGTVEAPTSGLVGTLDIASGSGVRRGERLAEIYHGQRHVVAYIPTGALYEVTADQRVALRYGFRVLRGTVTDVSAIAQRLPQEFQKAFQATEREQLLRIRIDSDHAIPPVFTKVHVTWPNSIFVRTVQAMRAGARAAGAAAAWTRQALYWLWVAPSPTVDPPWAG